MEQIRIHLHAFMKASRSQTWLFTIESLRLSFLKGCLRLCSSLTILASTLGCSFPNRSLMDGVRCLAQLAAAPEGLGSGYVQITLPALVVWLFVG